MKTKTTGGLLKICTNPNWLKCQCECMLSRNCSFYHSQIKYLIHDLAHFPPGFSRCFFFLGGGKWAGHPFATYQVQLHVLHLYGNFTSVQPPTTLTPKCLFCTSAPSIPQVVGIPKCIRQGVSVE